MQGQQGRRKNCPNWWLHSPTEIKRHRRLLHPNTSVTNMFENMMEEQPTDQSKKLQYCRFKVNGKVFNLSFPTYHQLLIVKKESGHKISQKRRAKEINSAENVAEGRVSREKKTIQNVFSLNKKVYTVDRNNVSDWGHDDNEEEEHQCTAEDFRDE